MPSRSAHLYMFAHVRLVAKHIIRPEFVEVLNVVFRNRVIRERINQEKNNITLWDTFNACDFEHMKRECIKDVVLYALGRLIGARQIFHLPYTRKSEAYPS